MFRFEDERVAKHHAAFLRDLGIAKGLLLGAIDNLKDREITDVYTKRESGTGASLVLKVINLAEQKLRKVIRDKPEKEKQIQDEPLAKSDVGVDFDK